MGSSIKIHPLYLFSKSRDFIRKHSNAFRVTFTSKNSERKQERFQIIKTNIEPKQSRCTNENKQQTISTEIYIVIRIYLS